MNHQSLSAFIWSVADLLRGDYKQSEYGKVILPFTVLRRLDCVLESTKDTVLAEYAAKQKAEINPEPFLLRKAGQSFYNISPLDMKRLMGDQDHIKENLFSYIQGFSPAVRDIFERFDFYTQIDRLAKSGLLYQVAERFANVDLHPDKVSNSQMGLVFEELIRKFAEISNETAGEHFTPREVIRLMVNLLFIEDDDVLAKPGVVRTIYDPTAGTGGMLSVAGEYLEEHNPEARLTMFGQELNDESYAICKADMLIKGQDVANIIPGNTFSDDGHPHKKFDYMLSNPPFGVEWKKVEKEIRKEHEQQGFNGRFGAGLPRVSDGSLLFLLHLISKMRPANDGGSRFGIVLNGSPLFTGAASSGESEIRRYVLENDLVEAIIGLPTDMFYNTGISTYVWILSNRKPEHRKGTVQLIDASGFWQKMRKSLGSKRKEMSDEHITEITRLFGQFIESSEGKKPISRIFKNSDFGYRTITVERPLRDENGKIILGERGKLKGKPQPDSSLRDTEKVPLHEDIESYFKREILPHAPDAWIDYEKIKVGYEINFSRWFPADDLGHEINELALQLLNFSNSAKNAIRQVTRVAEKISKNNLSSSANLWINEIPDGWQKLKGKWLFCERNERGYVNEKLLAATQHAGVIPKEELDYQTVEPTSDLSGYKLVEQGDFVISLRSFEGGIEYSRHRGVISPAYTVLRRITNIDDEYFRYLFKSSAFISAMNTHKKGIRDGQSIPFSSLREDSLPVPPLDTQREISSALSEIDGLALEIKTYLDIVQKFRDDLLSLAVIGAVDIPRTDNE